MKTGRKYGEKEKIQILIKSLIFCTLRIYIFSFYAFLFFRSLADVEYIEFPGCNHGSWNPAFNYPDFMEWLFNQKKK